MRRAEIYIEEGMACREMGDRGKITDYKDGNICAEDGADLLHCNYNGT